MADASTNTGEHAPVTDLHGETDPELYAHTLASIVLKNTEVGQAALKDAIVTWREQYLFDKSGKTLAEVVVEAGLLKKAHMPRLSRAAEYALCRREDKVFGRRAYRKGMITKTQLDESLAFQKQLFKALHEVKRLETILIDDGFLDADDAAQIWADFRKYTEARKRAHRPATIERAAASAGVPLDPAVAASESQAGERSAVDLDDIAALQDTARAAAAAAADEEDEDPAEMMSEHLPPAPDLGSARMGVDEQAQLEAVRRRQQSEALLESASAGDPITEAGDDDDFSDDNMNAALNDTIGELDLSDDFTPRADPGDGPSLDDLTGDDGDSGPTFEPPGS